MQPKEQINIASATEILSNLNMVLDPRIQYEISTGERQIPNDLTYEDVAVAAAIPELSKAETDRSISVAVEKSFDQFGAISLTMFTCPNGDATNIAENSAAILSDEFDKDQILFQRLKLLVSTFADFKKAGVPVTLNLVIGDTDFLTYYYPILEKAGLDLDLEGYLENARSYRDSICSALREISVKNNNLFEVLEFGDYLLPGEELAELTGESRINVVSLALNTDKWTTEGNDKYSQGDLLEEAFYTKRRTENPKRFDPVVFSDLDKEDCLDAAKIKFLNYEIQGEYVRKFSNIILMDELPPAMKSRMVGANVEDFLYIFPWIRKEDRWRNPETL